MTRFWRAALRYVDEESGDRRGSIHVTDLLYECLRRAWYSKRVGEPVSDPQGLLAVLVGQKLHEIQVCGEHEVELEHVTPGGVRIVGRADEVCEVGEDLVVLDKKTTRQLPSRPHDHHLKQVMFYAYMLWRKGRRVTRVAVLYLDVSNLQVRLFAVPVSQVALEQVGREVEQAAERLHQHLESGVPPARSVGWWCDYCSLFRVCMSSDE